LFIICEVKLIQTTIFQQKLKKPLKIFNRRLLLSAEIELTSFEKFLQNWNIVKGMISMQHHGDMSPGRRRLFSGITFCRIPSDTYDRKNNLQFQHSSRDHEYSEFSMSTFGICFIWKFNAASKNKNAATHIAEQAYGKYNVARIRIRIAK
jgi:hypothetical protein